MTQEDGSLTLGLLTNDTPGLCLMGLHLGSGHGGSCSVIAIEIANEPVVLV